MPMIKKSISVTDQQNNWIKAQFDTGRYGNESEIIRELIREKQVREQETPEQIKAIRSALIAAEESVKKHGYIRESVDEIWEEAKAIYRATHA